MAKQQRKSTQYTGVVYRERIHNGKSDKYFILRYRINSKQYEEAVGWASDGWTAKRCNDVLLTLRTNQRLGQGPYTLADMREASRVASEEAAQEKALAEETAKHESLTLGQWLTDYYIPSRVGRKAERTVKKDAGRSAIIADLPIGRLPMQIITASDVTAMLDDLRGKGRADGTLYQYLALIRHAFNMAMKHTMPTGRPLFVGQNPTTAVEFRQAPNARLRFLSRDDLSRLLHYMTEHGQTDLHDVTVISVYTGLRLGELLRLEWQDVDLIHGTVHVRGASDSKPGGSVPLNAAVMNVLQTRLENRTSHQIFPSIRGGRHREKMSHGFKDAVDALGINDNVTDARNRIVFHSLRHTFASWLAMSGVDLYRIKTLMRHRTIEMTQRYAHLLPDATRDAVYALCEPKV